MSWARLDDRFPWHPKVLAAGNAAIGLWVRCLVHCCAHATQGFVDEAMAKRMGTTRELQAVTDAKLWVRVAGGETCTVTGRRDSGKRPLPDVTVTMPGPGYWIRDFLHYHWRDEGGGATERSPRTAPTPSPSRRETRRTSAPSRSVLTFAPETSRAVSPEIAPETAGETQVSEQMSRVCARSEISTSTSTVPVPNQPPSGSVRTPRAREAADGGAGAPGVGVPPQSPEQSQSLETAPSAEEQAIVDRLQELGWRSKTRQFSGPIRWHRLALRVVRERGLTIPDIDELLLEAREKAKGDPMDLMGDWISPDHARWKDVLLDRRSRAKHAAAMKRGRAAAALADRDMHRNGEPKPLPKLQIPPVYGEPQKPKESQQ